MTTPTDPPAVPPEGEPAVEQVSHDHVQVWAGGRCFRLPAHCPHRGGHLRFGRVNPRRLRITCPLHHSTYDLPTGTLLSGPGPSTLPVTEVTPTTPPPRDEAELPWVPASETILAWDQAFHELLLADRIRMDAYHAAITETVQPGMTVLDLGTGTGILAQWALQAGAHRVYGIDLNHTVLAQAVSRIAAAGHADQFRPIAALSYQVELPERVDLIVSEILGNLADNEDAVAILADARARFLTPDGQVIPRQVDSYLVPVTAETAHDLVTLGLIAGAPATTLDQLLRERGAHTRHDLYYDTILPTHTHLATPRLARTYRLNPGAGAGERATGAEAGTYRTSTVFAAGRDGMFTGFKGYFVADLSATVALDISGDDTAAGATSNSWKHCYLPIRRLVPVRRGDRITLTFTRSTPHRPGSPLAQRYQWQGAVWRGTDVVGRFAQDTARHADDPPP